MLRRPASGVVRPLFTISKIFSSQTAMPIKAKLHVQHPLERGTKVCMNENDLRQSHDYILSKPRRNGMNRQYCDAQNFFDRFAPGVTSFPDQKFQLITVYCQKYQCYKIKKKSYVIYNSSNKPKFVCELLSTQKWGKILTWC